MAPEDNSIPLQTLSSIKSRSFAILVLANEVIFSSSCCFEQAKKILSPTSAPVNFIISSKDADEKNFPTGPFPEIISSFSNVKYASPDAPCSFAHLSILSKKLLGLSFVFLVTMHLTLEPDLTSFLKISNFTSSLEKISVISFIIKGFLKSGLSDPYFNIASLYVIRGNLSKSNFLFENSLKVLTINFSTTLKTSSCSTKDISKSNL